MGDFFLFKKKDSCDVVEMKFTETCKHSSALFLFGSVGKPNKTNIPYLF